MKSFYHIAASVLLMFGLLAHGMAANPAMNLVVGVQGPLNNSPNWASYSAINIIPGSSLLPVTSTNTVLYIGFTSGTFADINNMVLYTTRRDSSTITAVTPVKLGGITNPVIHLTDTTVCPKQPVSPANPCIVRLDPIALSLSTLSDYYFVMYFGNNSNNLTLGSAEPAFSSKTSLGGQYLSGDYTSLTVGSHAPFANAGLPYFLMFVMTN